MTPAFQTSRMAYWHSTGVPVLYPGDTAELCAARLRAAVDEAHELWTDTRPARKAAA